MTLPARRLAITLCAALIVLLTLSLRPLPARAADPVVHAVYFYSPT